MSKLKFHDIQEKDGKRLVVYSRKYTGKIWQVHHKLPDDYYLVQAFTEDYDNIYPSKVIKLTDNICQIEFNTEITGWASIFHLTPLLKRRRINFTDTTSVSFNHKYGNSDYLQQFWEYTPEGYVLFEPKNIDKSDYRFTKVEFEIPVTGYVQFCKSFPRERIVQIKDKIWQYNYMFSNVERQSIFVQCSDEFDMVFVPERISRIDANRNYTTDNVLELKHDDRMTGTINSVIHGHRI